MKKKGNVSRAELLNRALMYPDFRLLLDQISNQFFLKRNSKKVSHGSLKKDNEILGRSTTWYIENINNNKGVVIPTLTQLFMYADALGCTIEMRLINEND